MKKIAFIILSVFIFNSTGFTQEKLPDRANNFSYGFHLLHHQFQATVLRLADTACLDLNFSCQQVRMCRYPILSN